MSRFAIGQSVKCILPVNPRPNGENGGGGGWEIDKEFKIVAIDNIGENRIPIL